MIGYKLFKLRKDGTLGPLFINRTQRIPVGQWLQAEAHPTKGFAYRPGWHCTLKPEAPHLKTGQAHDGLRVWAQVTIEEVELHERPPAQGGTWALAGRMKVNYVLPLEEVITNE